MTPDKQNATRYTEQEARSVLAQYCRCDADYLRTVRPDYRRPYAEVVE